MSGDAGQREDLGSALREARESRGLSLAQITKITKIPTAVLEALERNDGSALPAGIFSRAFVRGFAAAVGLDPEAALREFLLQYPSAAATIQSANEVEANEVLESQRWAARTVVQLVGWSAAIAIMLTYLGTSEPTRSAALPRPVASDRGEIERIESLAGFSGPTTGSRPQPTSGSEANSNVAASTAERVAADRIGDRLVVSFLTTRPCWIAATVDGRVALRQLFQAGARETLDAERELVLTAGDAGALELTLNGIQARPLGGPGEVVTARFNAGNVGTYVPSR
jgi:transcriptional regulator with XRE-family HTH domain